MHALISVAGLLALVTLAFGQRAAAVVAGLILIVPPLAIVGLLVWKHLITIGVLD